MGKRLTTGIEDLDNILDGGLIPGKKVIVYGSTGIGKSVLGVTLAHAGIKAEGHPGILFDISKGGDDQLQLQYAKKLLNWDMKDWKDVDEKTTPQKLSDFAFQKIDYQRKS